MFFDVLFVLGITDFVVQSASMLDRSTDLSTARPYRFTFLLAALCVLGGMGSAGCTKGFSSRKNENAGSGQELRVAMATNPTSLDPAVVQDTETSDLLNNVFEGLVAYDENNNIVGRVAESWHVSQDGRKYTFKIRPGIKFSDGTDVLAVHVKTSFERALSPTIASPVAGTYLDDIVGAEEVLKGTVSSLSGIVIKDDKTVEISIKEPKPYFLGKLTYLCASIVQSELAKGALITDIKQAIGTGPFVLSEYKNMQSVTLKANDGFWEGKPAITTIERPVIMDAATRLNKFRSGNLDMVTVEKQDIPAVMGDPNLKELVQPIPRPAIFYILLNGKRYAPFKDRRVRRAFMMAIDRDRIAGQILNGQTAAKRWVPDSMLPGDLSVPKFDPAAAKKELAAAGLNPATVPPLPLAVRADNVDAKIIAESLAADLKKNLGVKVQPQTLDWGTMLKLRNEGKLPSAFLSWFADYVDPQNFLSLLLRSDAKLNFDGWSNTEFDKLTAAADSEKDAAKRAALYLQAEQIVLDEVPRIPLYFGMDYTLVAKGVKGVRRNLLGTLPHSKTTVEAAK